MVTRLTSRNNTFFESFRVVGPRISGLGRLNESRLGHLKKMPAVYARAKPQPSGFQKNVHGLPGGKKSKRACRPQTCTRRMVFKDRGEHLLLYLQDLFQAHVPHSRSSMLPL